MEGKVKLERYIYMHNHTVIKVCRLLAVLILNIVHDTAIVKSNKGILLSYLAVMYIKSSSENNSIFNAVS